MNYSAESMRQVAITRQTSKNNNFLLQVVLEEIIYPAALSGKTDCTVDLNWWNKYTDSTFVSALKELGYKLTFSSLDSEITISWKEDLDDEEIH